MGDWLATLGSWLVKPVRAVLAPWWEQLVEKKAEDQAVRGRLLEAIVAFRVADYQRKVRAVDADRARGLGIRVAERLRSGLVLNPNADLTSSAALAAIEREIELHAVGLRMWVQLACLVETGQFDPHQVISVTFTDEQGSHIQSGSAIFALQAAWPFTEILAVEPSGRCKISGSAISLLAEFCRRTPLPETAFQVQPMAQPDGLAAPPAAPYRLPKGWSPKEQGL